MEVFTFVGKLHILQGNKEINTSMMMMIVLRANNE
jgi:hypothetical protein